MQDLLDFTKEDLINTDELRSKRIFQGHGGSTYDLSNITIATPRYHKEILDSKFHFGGKIND